MATNPAFAGSPTELLRAGPKFRLDAVDPGSTPGFDGGREAGEDLLATGQESLSELQEKLFATSRFGVKGSILLVLQAMDTAGKGGIVRHVVGAVDPQGVHHHGFKAPTDEEKAHDFLWRIQKELPADGMIGVFDRSHYEDVLIHRVHALSPAHEIERRYQAIRDFEKALVESGTTLLKVMLHISAAEQKKRLQARLDRPDKHWKYSPNDVTERGYWDQYQHAYEVAIQRTDTDRAPWFVVPADNKWYARIAVQQLLLDSLEALNLQWPTARFDVEAEKARLADA